RPRDPSATTTAPSAPQVDSETRRAPARMASRLMTTSAAPLRDHARYGQTQGTIVLGSRSAKSPSKVASCSIGGYSSKQRNTNKWQDAEIELSRLAGRGC